MGSEKVTRRRFLRYSGIAAAGVAGIAGAAGGALFESRAVWALSVKGLDGHVAQTLLRMARLIYPHDRLSDDVYAGIIEHLGARAATDKALAARLGEGVNTLDRSAGKTWLALPESRQIAALEGLRDSAFFTTVQGAVLGDLYTDRRLWELVGYQGSSLEFGGYINRGFDDIDWLPEGD